MAGILEAVFANPLLPSTHAHMACELCQLRRTHPEVYAWLTRQLAGWSDGLPLTQQEIADEVSRRTGRSITQSQISNHKNRHFDPTLADAVETMTGHLVMMEFCAGMSPAQMAVAYAQMAVFRLGAILDKETSAKAAAPVASSLASLANILLKSDQAGADAELAQIEAKIAAMRQSMTEGEFGEQFAAWVDSNFPDLAPLLEDPEQLQGLLKAWRGSTALTPSPSPTQVPPQQAAVTGRGESAPQQEGADAGAAS